MDEQQRRQLRAWAAMLGEKDDAERRAVGRAMLMMLDEIDMLRGRLERAIAAERREVERPPAGPPPPPVEDADEERTAPLRLRDRIRHVAERHPTDGDG